MLRAALLLLALLLSAPAFALEACRDDVVFIKNESAELRFAVELAATPQDRSRGLMFREHLPRSAGMLFVFERPQRVAFWMKNTLIPLDMIFVDQFGEVTRVHSNAVPHDETAIPGGDDVFAVLEINGGLATSYGITAGSKLRHPVFLQGSAVWPC